MTIKPAPRHSGSTPTGTPARTGTAASGEPTGPRVQGPGHKPLPVPLLERVKKPEPSYSSPSRGTVGEGAEHKGAESGSLVRADFATGDDSTPLTQEALASATTVHARHVEVPGLVPANIGGVPSDQLDEDGMRRDPVHIVNYDALMREPLPIRPPSFRERHSGVITTGLGATTVGGLASGTVTLAVGMPAVVGGPLLGVGVLALFVLAVHVLS